MNLIIDGFGVNKGAAYYCRPVVLAEYPKTITVEHLSPLFCRISAVCRFGSALYLFCFEYRRQHQVVGKVGVRVMHIHKFQRIFGVYYIVDIRGLVFVAVGEIRGNGIFRIVGKRIFVAFAEHGKVVPTAYVKVAREHLIRAGIGEHKLIYELHLRQPEQSAVGHSGVSVIKVSIVCRHLNAVYRDK